MTTSPAGEQFSVRVKWDGRLVADVAKVSPLRRTTEVVVHRDGGAPNVARRSPGRTTYDPVALERGLIVDLEFERWANRVFDLGAASGAGVSLQNFRKDVRIEALDMSGAVVRAYRLFRCWISEYRAQSEVSGAGNTVFELIRLENEGWERDFSVVASPKGR